MSNENRWILACAACIALLGPTYSAPRDSRDDKKAQDAATQAIAGELQRILDETQNELKLSNQAIVEQGVDAGDALIERALADKPDPAATLLLGNLLYGRSPQKSFAAHEAAARAAPKDPTAALEWAKELHRAGRCKEALAAYKIALTAQPEGSAASALQVHCLLINGQSDEAVRTWNKINHPRTHMAVEKLFSDVFFTPDPWRKRDDLRRAARAGDRDAWVDLIYHDLNFQTDLWNGGPEDQALAFDSKEAEQALGGAPELWSDLSTLIRWRTEKINTKEFGAYVLEHHATTLPANLTLARAFVEGLSRAPPESATTVLKRYRESLVPLGAAGKPGALQILAYLYSATHDKDALRAIDEQGCRNGMPAFCASSIMGKTDKKEQTDALQAALTQFPNEPWFATFALRRVWQRGDRDRDVLHRYLRIRPYRMSSSYGFKFALSDLEGLLNRKAPNSELIALSVTQLDIDLRDAPK